MKDIEAIERMALTETAFALAERIAAALERIAFSQEEIARNDPLKQIDRILTEAGTPDPFGR